MEDLINKKVIKYRLHAPKFFKELLEFNPQVAQWARIPVLQFRALLAQVGQRAAELNDPKLNWLMARLTIYSAVDPSEPDYDPNAYRHLAKECVLFEQNQKSSDEICELCFYVCSNCNEYYDAFYGYGVEGDSECPNCRESNEPTDIIYLQKRQG